MSDLAFDRNRILRMSTSSRRLIISLVILLACLPLLLIGLDRSPAPWYDEGVKLNSARLMAERGVFGTIEDGQITYFSAAITSGPLEIGLIALSLRLFGVGYFQARLVSVLFTLAAVLLIERIGRRMGGPRVGLLIALGVLAMPSIGGVSLLLLGRQVLAEVPALTVVLLGLWFWLRSWDERSLGLAVLAGLSCGIGLISKPQFAFALMPALALVGAGRWLIARDPLVRSVAPTAAALGAFGLWSLIGRFGSDTASRLYNSEMLSEGVQVNLITGLWGTTLSQSALLISALCVLGGGYGLWRLWRALRSRSASDSDWLVAVLTVLALLNTFWFALIAIGWPRYGFLGLVAALMLLGLGLGRACERAAKALARHSSSPRLTWYNLAVVSLVLLTIGNALPLALDPGDNGAAAQAANYIGRHVPAAALVETWEWPVSAISAHQRFHHPHQQYLLVAMYQQSHHLPFDTGYDPLQADPDYLLAGPFSDWTRIYPDQTIAETFTLEATFGPYRLYKRNTITVSLAAAGQP